MGRAWRWLRRHLRTAVQVAFAALTNGYAAGFLQGKIYRGAAKAVCVPGLNCYSCPGALGSCPIGALQAVLGSRSYRICLYVVGFLFLFGAALGRFVCGWLCPFGLVQDLLHKIPLPKGWKRKKLPGDRGLRLLKYGILVGFVLLLPSLVVDVTGQGMPWFCEYICPSGTLMGGVPLLLTNPPLRAAAGGLFAWKAVLLAALLLLSVAVYRPFCRYLCPLGAVYGLFNPIALHRFAVEEHKCVRCGKCQSACKLDIAAYKTPNSRECIRCGECLRACPTGALHTLLRQRKAESGAAQKSGT